MSHPQHPRVGRITVALPALVQWQQAGYQIEAKDIPDANAMAHEVHIIAKVIYLLASYG